MRRDLEASPYKGRCREQGLNCFDRMLQVPNLLRAEMEKRVILFLILGNPRKQSKGQWKQNWE